VPAEPEEHPRFGQRLQHGLTGRSFRLAGGHPGVGTAERDVEGTGPQVVGPLAEALRDNSLAVGQELFASRMRAMSAMGYVAKRMISLLNGAPAPPFTLTHAIAFDHHRGEMRTCDLSTPGEHPELPYDPLTYDPHKP